LMKGKTYTSPHHCLFYRHDKVFHMDWSLTNHGSDIETVWYTGWFVSKA